MKVVITGGCGFIGKNLAHYLFANGYSVVIVDDFSVGKANGLPVCQILPRDVTNIDDCLQSTRCADYVVHLAALSGVEASKDHADMCWKTNVIGTINVLETAVSNEVKRVIIASSGAVDDRFSSPYALSKWTTEYIAGFHPQENVILRFSNVYGPHSKHKTSVINRSFWRIKGGMLPIMYGDGSHTRDFIHVYDVCRAIEAAMLTEQGDGPIGCGTSYTIKDVMNKITATTGNGLNPKIYPELTGEAVRVCAETEPAAWEMGFRAQIGLDEGLKMTWEAICQQ